MGNKYDFHSDGSAYRYLLSSLQGICEVCLPWGRHTQPRVWKGFHSCAHLGPEHKTEPDGLVKGVTEVVVKSLWEKMVTFLAFATRCDPMTGLKIRGKVLWGLKRTGFLSLSTINILGWTILCYGECLVHCRMLAAASLALDISSNLPVMTTKNGSRHDKMSERGGCSKISPS